VKSKLLSAAIALFAVAFNAAASAQVPPAAKTPAATPLITEQPPAQSAVPAAPSCCKLAALTPVELEIVTPASSKTSRQGEQIAIRVAEPVLLDGRVVLPAGTTGYAEVIQVSHRAIGGRAGELTLGLPYLMLDGQRIGLKRLRFGPGSGADRTQQATIAMAVVGIAGGLITGGSVDVKAGTRVNAVVASDTTIPVKTDLSMKE